MKDEKVSSIQVVYEDGTLETVKNFLLLAGNENDLDFLTQNIDPKDQVIYAAMLLDNLLTEYVNDNDTTSVFHAILHKLIHTLNESKKLTH